MRVMTAVATALPLPGLRIEAGPVELRGITDDPQGPLSDLAAAGIHDPGEMPSSTPWTTVPPDRPRRLNQPPIARVPLHAHGTTAAR
jgi:hypothetical protein